MTNAKVWFITGTSKGLGFVLVQNLLARGYKVAATSRNKAALISSIGKVSKNFLPLEMDIVNEESVQQAIKQTLSHFKKIDVLVNNAGYGQIGALEEVNNEESRKNFDVNVFGVLNVIRNIMPYFRTERSGHIFNISAIGGYTANYVGWGIYSATKFAVSAITETLAAECRDFGIKVTLVYPGYFKTSFLAEGSLTLPGNPISDYASAKESQHYHAEIMNGKQPGDPNKAVQTIIKISENKTAPFHLFLGPDAYEAAYDKIIQVIKDLDDWEQIATATCY